MSRVSAEQARALRVLSKLEEWLNGSEQIYGVISILREAVAPVVHVQQYMVQQALLEKLQLCLCRANGKIREGDAMSQQVQLLEAACEAWTQGLQTIVNLRRGLEDDYRILAAKIQAMKSQSPMRSPGIYDLDASLDSLKTKVDNSSWSCYAKLSEAWEASCELTLLADSEKKVHFPAGTSAMGKFQILISRVTALKVTSSAKARKSAVSQLKTLCTAFDKVMAARTSGAAEQKALSDHRQALHAIRSLLPKDPAGSNDKQALSEISQWRKDPILSSAGFFKA